MKKIILIMLYLISLPLNALHIDAVQINALEKSQQQKIDNFDKYVEYIFADWQIPGLAVAIVADDKLVYLKTIGERENGKKIDKDTVFRLASLSKTFTAELIGILTEQNKIKWNSKVAPVLENFRLSSGSATRSITIEHILSHSSGFAGQSLSSKIEKKYDKDQLAKEISNLDILCKAGKCFSYQNYIFNLAGDIAEKLTGKSFAKIVQDEIFTKLKMNRSSVGAQPYLESSNKALPYYWNGAQYKVLEANIVSNYYAVPAAAGVNSSIADMSIWLRAQMNAFPQVISKAILDKVQTPFVEIGVERLGSSEWVRDNIRSANYGMGWRIYDYQGEKLVFHSGLLNGFTNVIGFLPGRKIGIVALTNSNNPIPNILMARFIDEFLKLPKKDYNITEKDIYKKW